MRVLGESKAVLSFHMGSNCDLIQASMCNILMLRSHFQIEPSHHEEPHKALVCEIEWEVAMSR